MDLASGMFGILFATRKSILLLSLVRGGSNQIQLCTLYWGNIICRGKGDQINCVRSTTSRGICASNTKRTYMITYVAGVLTYQKRSKEQKLFRKHFPKEKKEKISNKSLLGKVSKGKKLKKKDSLEWYSAEQFLSFLDLASALRPDKSIHVVTICILQDLLA